MFDLWLPQIPDVNLTNSFGGWRRSKSGYRRGRSMPPANDTTAPISVTSSRVRPHAKGNAQETYSTTERIKLAAVDQYVFLLCLIPHTPPHSQPVLIGYGERIWQSDVRNMWSCCLGGVFVLLWENREVIWRQALLKRMTNAAWLPLHSFKLFIPGKLTPVSAKLQTHTRSLPLSLSLSHTHTHKHTHFFFTEFLHKLLISQKLWSP